jgi:putative spermidine/putrescine transport system substrate-binding protein
MEAIATMQDPDAQVGLFRALGNGPANPEASARIPPDLIAADPGAPENVAVQAKIDVAWYLGGDRYSAAQKQFLNMLST